MLFRKRKRKRSKGGSRRDYTNDLSLVYGYYNEAPVTYSRKGKKKKYKVMGFTPVELDSLCDSIPLRTDVKIKRLVLQTTK